MASRTSGKASAQGAGARPFKAAGIGPPGTTVALAAASLQCVKGVGALGRWMTTGSPSSFWQG
jgi:hypothetical protein